MNFMDSISSVLFSAELTLDNTLTFTYCNQSVEHFFWVTAAEVTHNPELLLQCLSAAHRQVFMDCVTRAIQENSAGECECEVMLAGQPSRWLLVHIAPYITPTGMAASGVMSDISAAHTEKLNAVNKANFFTQLQDGLADRFYYKDLNSVFLEGNKAWYTDHGYDSLSAIVGKSDADSNMLSPALKREIFEQEQEMMRTGIPIHQTEHHISSNGSECYTESKKAPIYDNHHNIIGLVGITRDITEKVKTANALEKAIEESHNHKFTASKLEASLRENAALLDALNMHAIVSVADSAGTIIEVNDAFCNISGYSREELLGKNHPSSIPMCNRASSG
jgi:PAS domain S-box-containing protein